MVEMPKTVTREDAQYAIDLVTAICEQVGPGVPGSSQEHGRAEMIKKELEACLTEEKVSIEEFSMAPNAFLGSQLISTCLMLVAATLNISTRWITFVSPWIVSAAAEVFSIVAALLFILEFVLGIELVDSLFKEKRSVNVIGVLHKPGTTKPKRMLILSAHHDSAYDFTWLRFTGYGYLVLSGVWLIGLVTVLAMSTIQLMGVATGNADLARIGTLGWGLIVFPILPSMVYAVFFTRGRENEGTVPGAADNLSGCGLVLAMCRFLVKNPEHIPEDAEIRFITFGSEEAGVRGSKRYVKRHLKELKELDVHQLNYETIIDPEIAILSTEGSGSVRNAREMVNSVVEAAMRAGVPFKVQPATLGTSCDAGPFSRAGLKATTLLGFKVAQMGAFYHQPSDRPEVLNIEALFNGLKITAEWISN
jgi:hypothetical protein